MAAARNVLAVDDGRTALYLANTAGLAAARNRGARATVMLSARDGGIFDIFIFIFANIRRI
jgi:hypothetical protein